MQQLNYSQPYEPKQHTPSLPTFEGQYTDNEQLSPTDIDYLSSLDNRLKQQNYGVSQDQHPKLTTSQLTDTALNLQIQRTSHYPNHSSPIPLTFQNTNLQNQQFENTQSTRTQHNPHLILKMSKKDQVYEKLAKTSKPYYIEVARMLKEIEERKQCPFKPQVNQEGRRYDNMQELFEHLHEESQFKNQLLAKREQLRISKETLGCTFTPKRKTNDKMRQSNSTTRKDNQNIHQKLYNDHSEIQRRKLWMAKAKELQLDEELKFTPQLVSKTVSKVLLKQGGNGSQLISPTNLENRFEKLYQDSKYKQEKLEKLQESRNQDIVTQRNRSQSAKQRNDSVTNENIEPRYLSLYNFSKGNKQRAQQLEQKVFKEQGITFMPHKYSNSMVGFHRKRNSASSTLQNVKSDSKNVKVHFDNGILDNKQSSTKAKNANGRNARPPKPK